MKNKAKAIRDIIKSIIDTWDPIGLLETGCPKNEYDIEIDSILGYIMSNLSIINSDELGKSIFNIFIGYFGVITFNKDLNDCKEVGKRLIATLFDKGYLANCDFK